MKTFISHRKKLVLLLLAFVFCLSAGIYAGDSVGKYARRYLSTNEYVTIGDRVYAVPYPWQGKKIGSEDATKPDNLVRLPLDLTHNQTNIYVTEPTRDAFVIMAEAAQQDGISLLVDSGYRSPSYQKQIYKRKISQGKDFYEIAKGVAPPGYSEHMLGSTVDLVPSMWKFAETPAQAWLQENAYRFNFIESYPENNPEGFFWEPWHWRYIGP